MSKRFSTALCVAALLIGAALPVQASADETPVLPSTSTATPTDTGDTPLSLTPEQIEAMQQSATDTDDKSFFDKAGDFVTDNAPFIILGIVVLAAILAGIFIMRGRSKAPKAPKAPKAGRPAAGAPAAVPSASELRRRKRAAMQRSREEERLRRKSGMEGRKAGRGAPPSPAPAMVPLSANLPVDPIEAEKQSAKDQQQAAGAVARSAGAIPAPPAPTQTAPAAAVAPPLPAGIEPDTVYNPPGQAYPQQPAAAPVEPQPVPEQPGYEQPEYPAQPEYAPEGEYVEQPAAEPQTAVEQLSEPAVEAPGLDSHVGEAAAAFAAGGAAGALAGRAGATEEPDADAVAEDTEDDAAREAEERLRAKVAEIKAEQARPVAEPEVTAPEPEPETEPEPEPELEAEPEPEPEPDPAPVADETVQSRLAEAERREAELPAEEIPPTPPGLAAVEQRLQASSDQRDRTLQEAEERLRRIEQRAEDAERRAAFAERLAQLKIEESERERRLSDVITGIDRAEERAKEAEQRAKAAEEAAAAALEETTGGAASPAPSLRPSSFDPPAGSAPVPVAPINPPERSSEQVTPPARPASPLFGGGLSGGRSGSGSLNLNSATFEELRDADLSVTQATRILAYRERFGGYRSVEDLEKVPGFPAELIESLRGKITV